MSSNNDNGGGFAPLTFGLIGVNGLPGEEPLEDEVNRAIQTIAAHLQDDLSEGRGTIAIKLTLRRIGAGSGSISVESAVDVRLPKRRRAVASGVLTRAGLVTLEHQQAGLFPKGKRSEFERTSTGGES